jgi:hypothetical protein
MTNFCAIGEIISSTNEMNKHLEKDAALIFQRMKQSSTT